MKEHNPDKPLAQVFHFGLYGNRKDKYNFLENHRISSIEWTELQPVEPDFFFVKKDFGIKYIYDKGFSINEIFTNSASGVQTEFDELVTHKSKEEANAVLTDLKKLSAIDFSNKYKFQNKIHKVEIAQHDVISNTASIQEIDYKVFNLQYCIYTGKTNGIMGRPRFEIMKNIISKENISICLLRTLIDSVNFSSIFLSKNLVDKNFYGFQTAIFPLYLYPETTQQQSLLDEDNAPTRKPNLDAAIVQKIADAISLPFVSEKNMGSLSEAEMNQSFAPIDILDYIYAVLHSPAYRETYKEFLKIDFPRVPYPKDAATFWQLVALGAEIRKIHLLESEKVEDYITGYPVEGENVVGKVRFLVYEDTDKGDTDKGDIAVIERSRNDRNDRFGKVYINDTQYFSNVPEVAWNFYIGGYQPAQKWLKDRKERQLSFEDILHYQKIIVALVETDRLMQEVDKVGVGV